MRPCGTTCSPLVCNTTLASLIQGLEIQRKYGKRFRNKGPALSAEGAVRFFFAHLATLLIAPALPVRLVLTASSFRTGRYGATDLTFTTDGHVATTQTLTVQFGNNGREPELGCQRRRGKYCSGNSLDYGSSRLVLAASEYELNAEAT